MKKSKQKIYPQIFTIYLRYLIGGGVFASFIKIKGKRFTGESGELAPINEAWHLFETLYQSGLYWQFLGFAQLIAGGLLMTQKYSKLGAVIFLPISLNIFVITVSYDFNFTPIITGLLLLANLYLLIWDWNTYKIILGFIPDPESSERLENYLIWTYTGFMLFLFTAVYRISVDTYDIIFWFSGFCLISTLGFIFYKIRPIVKAKFR